jgi:hypothetical protein
MITTTQDQARRIAQWQIMAGWLTVMATLVARLTTVYWQLASGPIDSPRFGQAILKSALLIAVVVWYRRALWPSHLMLAVWPIGFLYAWLQLHTSPSILAVGLLVGTGLFLGMRGTRTLRALDAHPAPAV